MLIFINDNSTIINYPLNLISNFTYRAISSLITSLILSLGLGFYLIKWSKKIKLNQIIRKDGPKSHFSKSHTPTMGGLVILLSVVISILIWNNLSSIYVWYVLIIFIGFGIIGFVDDYLKIIFQDSQGLTARYKYFWMSVITIILIILINNSTIDVIIPLLLIKKRIPKLLSIMLTYFTIIGSGNAVNLTDGLDGLAILPIILIVSCLSFIAYMTGIIDYMKYFCIINTNYSNELVIICNAIVGAGLGFLYFNRYPAKIFMGDIGSLSLGGVLGVIAVLLGQELLLIIMGGIFVIETLSVIIQVIYFKIYQKRVFLMTPIHHHYELKGISEPVIVKRFWIVSIILVFLGLLTIKIH